MNDTIRMTKQRRWSESKAHSSWQIFKIMAEFVDGFESSGKDWPLHFYIWFCAHATRKSLLRTRGRHRPTPCRRRFRYHLWRAVPALWKLPTKVLNSAAENLSASTSTCLLSNTPILTSIAIITSISKISSFGKRCLPSILRAL